MTDDLLVKQVWGDDLLEFLSTCSQGDEITVSVDDPQVQLDDPITGYATVRSLDGSRARRVRIVRGPDQGVVVIAGFMLVGRLREEHRASLSQGRRETEERLWRRMVEEYERCFPSAVVEGQGRERYQTVSSELARARDAYRRFAQNVWGQLRGQGSRVVPKAVRRRVMEAWEAQGRVCALCGKSVAPGDAIHLDHIVPFPLGGKTTAENLRPVHATCNRQRGLEMGSHE